MPYKNQKPYIKVNGQKVVSSSDEPQRLPFCDKCDELAATNASVYTEQAADKWWKWLSHPKFKVEEEALMGCREHPVEPEIRFLDGTVEPFIRLPLTRWQQLTKWDALVVAGILAIVFAVAVEFVFKLFVPG